MTQLTYYDDGSPEHPLWGRDDHTNRDGAHLRHGITMSDLESAARLALSRNRGVNQFTRAERYDIAYSAAATALYEAGTPPTVLDLTNVGARAIAETAYTEKRHHGIDHSRRIGEQRPRYAAYWTPLAKTPLEDWVVERHALAQVWQQLTPHQQEALAALAVHGTADAAAEALGKKRRVTYAHIRNGRTRVAALWLEGETPLPPPPDRRVGSYSAGERSQTCVRGHLWDEVNTRWERRPGRLERTRRVCRACQRDLRATRSSGSGVA